MVTGVRLGTRENVEAKRVELPDRAGSRRNASMCATSNGSYLAQIPSADRKSGIPDSVEIPAPVRTTQGCRSRTSSARRSTLISRYCRHGRLHLLDAGARALCGHRRAGNRAQLGLRRVVRGRARRVPAGVRRRLPRLREHGIEALVLESLVRYGCRRASTTSSSSTAAASACAGRASATSTRSRAETR